MGHTSPKINSFWNDTRGHSGKNGRARNFGQKKEFYNRNLGVKIKFGNLPQLTNLLGSLIPLNLNWNKGRPFKRKTKKLLN